MSIASMEQSFQELSLGNSTSAVTNEEKPAGGETSAPQAKALWVGNLTPETTEAILFESFSPIGPVTSIRVCRNIFTQKSLGYAYVNFAEQADAERALEELNYKEIDDSPIKIMWQSSNRESRFPKNANIIIHNLPGFFGEKDLDETFKHFGEIMSCSVKKNSQDKTMGFVQFATAEGAAEAIAEANEMVIDDNKLFVTLLHNKKEFTNLYINNIDVEQPAEQYTLELEALFAEHGEIGSFVLPKDDQGKLKGYGFCDYKEHASAQKAIEVLNGFEFKGTALLVGELKKKEHLSADKKSLPRAQQGTSIIVKNLDSSIDTEQLKELFAKHGTIVSASVQMDSDNKSKGFGFVNYSSPEEASAAVGDMNLKIPVINGNDIGKPLKVSLTLTKAERKAQIDQKIQMTKALLNGGGYPNNGMQMPYGANMNMMMMNNYMQPGQGPMRGHMGYPGPGQMRMFPGQQNQQWGTPYNPLQYQGYMRQPPQQYQYPVPTHQPPPLQQGRGVPRPQFDENANPEVAE